MIDLPVIGGDVCAKLDAAKAAYDGAVIQGVLGFFGAIVSTVGIFGGILLTNCLSQRHARSSSVASILIELRSIAYALKAEKFQERSLEFIKATEAKAAWPIAAPVDPLITATPIFEKVQVELHYLDSKSINLITSIYRQIGRIRNMSEVIKRYAADRNVPREQLIEIHRVNADSIGLVIEAIHSLDRYLNRREGLMRMRALPRKFRHLGRKAPPTE